MAESQQKSNILIPALAIGAVAGVAIGIVIARRLCRPRGEPDAEARRLLRSCEALLASIESSLAAIRSA